MPTSKPGGYTVNEDVNQGPHGAPKGKVSPGHGQSGDGGSKDDLVPLSPMQHDPYRAKASDFPVKEVDAFHGQDGGIGTATGKNDLAQQAVNQYSPRHLEDGGPGPNGSGTPSGWVDGNRAARVASAFPIRKSQGESNSSGGETSISESVNLSTGKIQGGSSQTKVGEVPESKVKIASR